MTSENELFKNPCSGFIDSEQNKPIHISHFSTSNFLNI